MSFGVEGKSSFPFLLFFLLFFFCCCFCWRLGVFGHFISKIRLIKKNLKTHKTHTHNNTTQHTTQQHNNTTALGKKEEAKKKVRLGRRRRRRLLYSHTNNGARLISRPLAGEKRHQVEERPEQREQGNQFDAAAKSGERRASDAGEEGKERGAKSEGFSNREIDDGTGEGRRGEEGESERKTKDEPVREQQSAPGETAEVDRL